MSLSVNDELTNIFNEMAEQFKSLGFEIEIPPSSMTTHGANYIHYELGTVLVAEFPFNERFLNPLKAYQGGFLCAAIDDVFGPLTYMAAKKPALTIQMNTTFIRPFTAKDKKITVRAEVISKSKTLLVLNAVVRTEEGKLIATSTSQSIISN